MGPQATADRLGITFAAAAAIASAFFNQYGRVKAWMKEIKRCACKGNQTFSLFDSCVASVCIV